MSEDEFEKLKEDRWRRALTPSEEISLENHFETDRAAQRIWNEEAALNQLLAKLPDEPISTNFTSRVLQMVERETVQPREESVLAWFKFHWLSRVAFASLLLCATLVSIHEYRTSKRTQIAHNVAAMATATTVPQEWLQNFEAINRLGKPPVDDELLAALQ